MNNRLYINLTNKCNRKCPFCFMWSGPRNNIFIEELVFKSIINTAQSAEIRLGGGEPTLHPKFLDFVEFCLQSAEVTKVIIDTNGVILDNYIQSLFNLSQKYYKPIVVSISINYSLIEQNNHHLDNIKKWIEVYSNRPNWEIRLGVHIRLPEALESEWLSLLAEPPFNTIDAPIHTIQYTARAKQNKISGAIAYKKPNYTNFNSTYYACDGTCFGSDVKAREKYEEQLSIDL